jgi:uncharacterized protein DUF6883
VKLPNGDRAIVDIRKLTEYSLNDRHEHGQHKARVFVAALGMTETDAEELRQLLLANAAAAEAEPRYVNEHGARYVIDFEVARGNWTARVRSAWIILHGEDFPRLTSCYVLT